MEENPRSVQRDESLRASVCPNRTDDIMLLSSTAHMIVLLAHSWMLNLLSSLSVPPGSQTLWMVRPRTPPAAASVKATTVTSRWTAVLLRSWPSRAQWRVTSVAARSTPCGDLEGHSAKKQVGHSGVCKQDDQVRGR